METSFFRSATQNSLGARNNNPLNIRNNPANNWQGGVIGEGGFVRFTNTTMGVRAGLIILRNYRSLHGIRTIRGTIQRFAPPNENNTMEYVRFVQNQTGLNADLPFEFSRDNLYKIVRAMCLKESGFYLSTNDFMSSWNLAFPFGTGVDW